MCFRDGPWIRLPSVLTTYEFAYLVRLHPETVREKIRARTIVAHKRPAKIPCRELLKFGVTLADAAQLLAARAADNAALQSLGPLTSHVPSAA